MVNRAWAVSPVQVNNVIKTNKMKVKLLNIQSVPKLRLVKAIKKLTSRKLADSAKFADSVRDIQSEFLILDTQLSKDETVTLLENLGINYVFMDEKCPTHEDNGLKDIVDTAKAIENAGVYLIPTETGIQIVIVIHIPNESILVSQLKGIFKDAHFDVGAKEIEDGKGMRLLFSKTFPNGAVSLDDINELAENAKNILNAYWLHRDFRELGKIVDNIVKEAFEKIEW